MVKIPCKCAPAEFLGGGLDAWVIEWPEKLEQIVTKLHQIGKIASIKYYFYLNIFSTES